MWYIDIIGIIIALMGVAIFVYGVKETKRSKFVNIALLMAFTIFSFIFIIIGMVLIFLI